MKALIVREPWIDLILDGHKTWELRTQPTSIRGRIALIRKGSREIEGVVKLVDVLPQLSPSDLAESIEFHRVPSSRLQEVTQAGWLTPWVLVDAYRLSAPVPFTRPSGPVTWVDLDVEAMRAVQQHSAVLDRSNAATVQAVSVALPTSTSRPYAEEKFDSSPRPSGREPQMSPALESKLVLKAEELGFAVKPRRSSQTKMLELSVTTGSGKRFVFVDRMPKSEPQFRVFLSPEVDKKAENAITGIPGVERFRNGRSGHYVFRHSAFRAFAPYEGQEPEAHGWLVSALRAESAFGAILQAVEVA
ncbi:ASCH domain-containing protein [Mesorhizobium sp. B3-1-3]|uniref:ASCH domain-containing protein n=1 Tax=unclassified Mesorhizobium TaxID=325217 RepID=UPI00112C626E|nr:MULTISPECIES: ASCH domain-containing protein [unclassified Mesorhizobium]TPI65516.1 ASCH domain-containing protein [Mesorhizobium sp. B3-1-8]TPI72711.1 ASCH domain-containing protein [Mesorhizobium sp. B3-1-3]